MTPASGNETHPKCSLGAEPGASKPSHLRAGAGLSPCPFPLRVHRCDVLQTSYCGPCGRWPSLLLVFLLFQATGWSQARPDERSQTHRIVSIHTSLSRPLSNHIYIIFWVFFSVLISLCFASPSDSDGTHTRTRTQGASRTASTHTHPSTPPRSSPRYAPPPFLLRARPTDASPLATDLAAV